MEGIGGILRGIRFCRSFTRFLKPEALSFFSALENKAKQVAFPDIPPEVDNGSEDEEAFEGADGDPHFIITLRDMTVCFNVDGPNGSSVLLLKDLKRGLIRGGLFFFQ